MKKYITVVSLEIIGDDRLELYQEIERIFEVDMDDTNKILTTNEIVDLLNEFSCKNEELKKENENQNNILKDFMVMLSRLQAEPDNKSLQMMAKDMLRMMGKDIMGDSE